jgi:phenylpropionate dioxygenase-like ring-hydroxylating dioxygenase large terminal subunit
VNRDTELALLDRALDKLRNHKIFPGVKESRISVDRYYSQQWFDAEQERIFSKVPSLLVHSSELPEPNSFVTMRHFGRSLIVCRNKDGEARAFLNVCRHRGTLLEPSDGGCKKAFTCGYHAWSYDTDGRLVNIPAPYCFPETKVGERDLVSLPVVERYGFVWLMPEAGQGAEDLDRFLEPIREDFADLSLSDYQVYGLESKVWKTNWKLVVEGTLEGYHFPVLHPKSAHPLFEDKCVFYDKFGQHLRSVLPKRSLNFIKNTERDKWRLLSVANVVYTLFPNETILNQSDHFLWINPHPIGPAETLVRFRLLIPKDAMTVDREEMWRENKELTYQVQYEDLEIYSAIQLGLESRANTDHCYGLQEDALRQFNENIDRYLR